MAYATLADLIDRFREQELIQLTDPAALAIDQVVIAKALTDADADIDMYLAARHTLPLASVPRVLIGIACDLARAYLYEDRITDHVRKRMEDATAKLKSLSRGETNLGLNAAAAQTPTAGGPRATERSRAFGRDLLGDY